MNDIFTTTFEKHKKLLLESLNDNKWEEKADWSVFDTPEDTSKSFEKLLGISEAKNPQPATPTTPPAPTIVSVPTGEWWEMYNELPPAVQSTARERYNLFLTNPKEPSLNFKPLQHLIGNYWSININANYRTIGIKTDIPNGFKIKWIFIGNHSQYDNYWKRLLKNKM
jgi:effector-binding domain-containing protein